MANAMRGWVRWGVIGLVGAACTRDNPAFDEGGTGQTEGSATMGATSVVTDPTAGDEVGETVDSSGGGQMCVGDGDCDDTLWCTGEEKCLPGGNGTDDRGCLPGTRPCQDGMVCVDPVQQCVLCTDDPDGDNDMFEHPECGGADCDDDNPNVHPMAPEICDASLDEDCDSRTVGEQDMDGDTFDSNECCNTTNAGGLDCGPDCDDTLAGIVGPGDWAHCAECGQSCDVLQACNDMGMCFPARRVFVTSTPSSGDLGEMGGAPGAHAFCQDHANDAMLGGVFMAWIHGGGADVLTLEHAAVPYVMLDGRRIANDWDDLIDGSIQVPLDLNERRETVAYDNVWTGLGAGDAHCGAWTLEGGGCQEGGPCGAVGEIAFTDERWDGDGLVLACNTLLPLYCIEQGAG